MPLDDRLARAAENGDTAEVMRLLAEDSEHLVGERQLALLWAAAGGQTETLVALVAGGADLNAPEPCRGHLAIVAAAQQGQAATIKAMLSMGADPRIRDSHGRSAAEEARRRRHVELADFLDHLM